MTDSEHADLLVFARLLGIPASEAETVLHDAARPDRPLHRDSSCLLRRGGRVVFTGDMDTGRTEIEALAATAGLCVTTSVSQQDSTRPIES